MNSLANCVGFLALLGATHSRFSEAGRACSGEFWADQPYDTNREGFDWVEFGETCASEGGCRMNGVNGVPVATTYHTGYFLFCIIVIAWVMIGVMCLCMCVGMMMMSKMMKKSGDQV